jgi:hypothetical protein
VAFIRRVRTASGATAVQIAEYVHGRQRIVEHVGSAHTDAELGVLLERARELLADPAQGVLDLGVEPALPVKGLVGLAGDAGLFGPLAAAAPAARTGPGRVVGTDSRALFAALADVFTQLGFDGLGDEAVRDGLAIANVVKQLRPLRSATIAINGTTQTFAPDIPAPQQTVLDAIHGPELTH